MITSARTRKERDRLLREEDFLNAAERLFSQRGYFETSIEDVAHAAEYATGTIYRYFASKKDLYQRLLLRKGRAYFEQTKAAVAQNPTPRKRVEALVRGKANFFFENRAFMRIYVAEVSGPLCDAARQLPDDLRAIHEEYLALTREILRDGMANGVFRKLDVEMTMASLHGLMNELLTHALEEDCPYTEDQVVGFIFDFLQGGLLTRRGRT
jgi:AcrR family transcriptional regulator